MIFSTILWNTSIESKAASTSRVYIGDGIKKYTLTGPEFYIDSGVLDVPSRAFSLVTGDVIPSTGNVVINSNTTISSLEKNELEGTVNGKFTVNLTLPVYSLYGRYFVIGENVDVFRIYAPINLSISVDDGNKDGYGFSSVKLESACVNVYGATAQIPLSSSNKFIADVYINKPRGVSWALSNNQLSLSFTFSFNANYHTDSVVSNSRRCTPKIDVSVGQTGSSPCTFFIESSSLDTVTSTDIDRVDESIKKGNEIAEETKETSKGIFASIKDFFGSFFQNLIDSVIGLFVPSSDEMSGLFEQLNQFFSDRFGFLYAPFDYIIQLLGVFTSATGNTGLTLPGFSIMGHEVWPDITYDLASDPLVGQILGYVRMGTGVLLAGYFIMFLQDFFKERFGTG